MKNILIILLLLSSVIVLGQNTNDDEYSKFANSYNSELKNYREQYNSEFSSFVKQYWSDFEVFKAKVQFAKPKPRTPISIATPPIIESNEEFKAVILKNSAPQTNASLDYIKPDEVKADKNMQVYDIVFCGNKLSIRIANDMLITLKDINENTVGEAWEKMSKTNFLATVYDCQSAVKNLALNDWGYFLLLKQIANGLFKGKPNENNVFTLFMLNQTGYDARIGKINNQELTLLLPFVQEIYELLYIQSEDNTYYVMAKDKDITTIATYKKSFVSANHTFDMGVNAPFNLGLDGALKATNYGSELLGKDINIEYNANDIIVYKAYPSCVLEVYCNASMSKTTEQSLRNTFESSMKDMCQLEKVNLVLEFIQAMPYKTDIEQFGYEKYFFPEEVFSYPYCDCEDRAALFKWIITNIVGLEVINLEYDDHVSAAVKFTEQVNGDYVSYNNAKYVICDPTYIGAPAGLSMPQYKNATAKIIN